MTDYDDTDDTSTDPDPRVPLSEHTVSEARADATPAESAGGPPRRDDLTMTPSDMGRRVLQDAVETTGQELSPEE